MQQPDPPGRRGQLPGGQDPGQGGVVQRGGGVRLREHVRDLVQLRVRLRVLEGQGALLVASVGEGRLRRDLRSVR